ncbi:MAG: hypothetical protein RLZZ292_2629, partial [Bacteroidota bacterium]
MKVRFWQVTATFLKRDLSMSLTLGYLVLIIVGMLFNGMYYTSLGFNIFNYSDISDFLLAPFRDPIILLFMLLSISLIYSFNVFDDWLERNFPKTYLKMVFGFDKDRFQNWYSVKGNAITIIVYVFYAAQIYSSIKFNKITQATVSSTKVILKDNKFAPTDTLIYAGKTNSFVFLYLRNKQETAIIPMNDVLQL